MAEIDSKRSRPRVPMTSLVSTDDHATLWSMIALGTALAIWLEQRYRWAARLSAPVLALVIAMVLSNARIVPPTSPAYDFVGDWLMPLAIPLLLFRANLREIIRIGGRMFLVFHISAVGTLLGTALAVVVFKDAFGTSQTIQAAGLMAASYMGGSVNFMAIKTSYGVSENIANPLIVADNFVMAGMFVLLLSLGAARWIQRRFPHPHSADADPALATKRAAEHWQRKGISLLDIAWAFGFAFAVLAFATLTGKVMEALFAPDESRGMILDMAAVLLTNKFVLITCFSLFLATVLAVPLREINGPEELGAYLLALFLFTIGLPADLISVFRSAPLYFVFCGTIALVNLLFTLGIGRLLKQNLEELLVAVNANLGGAPSAAAMAISAGWPRLVLPAILVGVWGYVVGTPVGVLVTEWLTKILVA